MAFCQLAKLVKSCFALAERQHADCCTLKLCCLKERCFRIVRHRVCCCVFKGASQVSALAYVSTKTVQKVRSWRLGVCSAKRFFRSVARPVGSDSVTSWRENALPNITRSLHFLALRRFVLTASFLLMKDSSFISTSSKRSSLTPTGSSLTVSCIFFCSGLQHRALMLRPRVNPLPGT